MDAAVSLRWLWLRVHSILARHAFWIGLILRFVLAWILPLWFDGSKKNTNNNNDGTTTGGGGGVTYTDIDYHVFMDAAQHVVQGRSPFQRTTYRYTPFLAQFLALLLPVFSRESGRYIFCFADALCGLLIASYRRQQRRRRRRQENHLQHRNQPRQQEQQQRKDQHNEGQQSHDNNQNSTTLTNQSDNESQLTDAIWWLYNPLAINICTRGSAESFLALLPVLTTIWLIKWWKDGVQVVMTRWWGVVVDNTTPEKKNQKSVLLAALAGICHGIAVHAKLYPIIYSLSYVIALSDIPKRQKRENEAPKYLTNHPNNNHHGASTTGQAKTTTTNTSTTSTTTPGATTSLPTTTTATTTTSWYRWWCQTWVIPMLGIAPITFALTATITFVGITTLGIYFHGWQSLNDGLLYHFSRIDHRHNYSMHWYWIYLTRASAVDADGVAGGTGRLLHLMLPWIGRLLFLPQIILLVYSSFVLTPLDLPLAMFVQTFCFVLQNKVITGQYFTWYLCLLPLCSHHCYGACGGGGGGGGNNVAVLRAVLILLGSILCWLGSAYLLEMQGWSVHRLVWVASVLFFVAQVHLLLQILDSIQQRRHQQQQKGGGFTTTQQQTLVATTVQDDESKKVL